jgi:hypothetical protein
LNRRIDAVEISREALGVAAAARSTSEHGLGYAGNEIAKQLETRLFK